MTDPSPMTAIAAKLRRAANRSEQARLTVDEVRAFLASPLYLSLAELEQQELAKQWSPVLTKRARRKSAASGSGSAPNATASGTICWYDSAARRTRRIATGTTGGSKDDPPGEAQQALANHFAANHAPASDRQAASEARLLPILTRWLQGPAALTSRAAQYGYAVTHWATFLDDERTAGRLHHAPVVSDMRKSLQERYIETKLAAGRSPETIRGDLAALRAALRWAHREEYIDGHPFVIDVPEKQRKGPREETFSLQEIAKILSAARSRPEWEHIFHFTMGMLAGFGRAEAVLVCNLNDQLDRQAWNLNWLPSAGRQTSKRRSIVRVAPVWRAWLEDMDGRLVDYPPPKPRSPTATPRRPGTRDISSTWKKVLSEADVRQLPPNTMRHTIISEMHAIGVPESQIETAAGHRGTTTNKRNYRHLRPEYLRELTDGIESYFFTNG